VAEGGLDFDAALSHGALGAARANGLGDRLGSIAPGKLADLILVDGDPSADPGVLRNLRLVVKIAWEYRRAAFNLLDLIQEGNVGLMNGVRKFDPERGVKLSSYAAWWIRAYIIRYLMDNWRLVKLGTTQAQRKIAVQYTQRAVGRKVVSGGTSFMPLRVNYAGVMPIIFAQAILMFPQKIFLFLGQSLEIKLFVEVARTLDYGAWMYLTLYALMILFFSYFWVATQFNEIQIADDLKKYGGYIPGVRPGQATSNYLHNAMSRITLAGAVFLTIIAVIPILMNRAMNVPFDVATFFGGTSMLILVGVMLDTMRQMESHLLMRHYDGFLKKGRLKGRF